MAVELLSKRHSPRQVLVKTDRIRIGVKTDTGVSVHCRCAWGDYDTLCGVDANDSVIGHFGAVPVAVNTKIDCPACKAIFETAKYYRLSDFK
jgi:hypothetical protein